MDIIEEVMPVDIITHVHFRNKRVYEVAWAIAKLQGFNTLEEFINEAVLEAIEMVVDGRGGPAISNVDWGFETRWQMEKEREKEGKQAKITR